MEGNLTIDIGNTSVKVAHFDGTRLKGCCRIVWPQPQRLEAFIREFKPDSAIVSSTASTDVTEAVEQIAAEHCSRVLRLTHETLLPIRLDYRTPQTLGRDRIATAVAAWEITRQMQEACDVLVVDAGTAVTYDLVTADGCFAGGNIAPGLALRFKALHEHTGRLPLVGIEGDTPLMGYDTETAIRSGVLLGLLGEVKNHIADLRLSHPGMKVFLTGGDGLLLFDRLDVEDIVYNEYLAAEGLNRILLYNQANEKD